MPELPEVEMFKRYGEKHFLNRKIKEVTIDDPLVCTVEPEAFKNLYGEQILSLKRRGKYVYGETSKKDLFLTLHFGMTGKLKVYDVEGDRPKGTRVSFELENGFMAWINPRKFGRVGLTDDVDGFFSAKNFGLDALDISEEAFLETFSKTKGPVKPRLLDQKNVAGIGNIYADEILFQTAVHPASEAQNIPTAKWEEIYHKMKEVFETAIEHKAQYHTYPEHYLLYDRTEERQNPPLSRIKVGGRTTFFDEKTQRKY
jgi:formamidopyrimidine-DNA glycosylase